jgi:hypothetical protein
MKEEHAGKHAAVEEFEGDEEKAECKAILLKSFSPRRPSANAKERKRRWTP